MMFEKGEGKMTNGERIRNMTDEELTQFLMSSDSIVCSHCNRMTNCSVHDCDRLKDVFMQWLACESEAMRY